MSHYIPAFARESRLALCGVTVALGDYCQEPTCKVCQAELDARDEEVRGPYRCQACTSPTNRQPLCYWCEAQRLLDEEH